jgi:hypothetical protein
MDFQNKNISRNLNCISSSNHNNNNDSNNNNSNYKNDQIVKIILEENQILKKTISQKFPNEETLTSLLDLLEIQRSKIDNIEQGIV